MFHRNKLLSLGWKLLPLALFFGLFMGVVARLWMRWISTDPEFTWSGTLGIVIGFGIFTFTQGAVSLFLSKKRARWSSRLARTLGSIFSLQLFAAAGASMLPTVLFGSLAAWKHKWKVWLRVILATLSFGWTSFIIQTVIVKDFGWSIATIGRIALMISIYTFIIRALNSTVSGQSRRM